MSLNPSCDGVSTTRTPLLARRLYDATFTRAESFASLAQSVVNEARNSIDPVNQVAAELFEACVALQNLDMNAAKWLLDNVEHTLASIGDQHMHWWFHQTSAEVLLTTVDIDAGIAAYERAIAIAQATFGFEHEAERSFANLLFHYWHEDRRQDGAETLLRFLRFKPTTELYPLFYMVVADALFWLGEYEAAYAIRSSAVKNRPHRDTGNWARDHRELARYLHVLGQRGDAARHLEIVLEWLPSSTPEQAVSHHSLAAEFAAAGGDFETAQHHLEAIRDLGGEQAVASAAIAVAEYRQERGDYAACAELLAPLGPEEVRTSYLRRFYDLQAKIAFHRGKPREAIEYLERAQQGAAQHRVLAETIVTIRSELLPWLAVAESGNDKLGSVASHRAFRSQWLLATSADIRRCVEPAADVFEPRLKFETRLYVLGRITDDLMLIGEFLADADDRTFSGTKVGFWHTYEVANRLVSQSGATLTMTPSPGSEVSVPAQDLAGRLTFGLVAMIADNANTNSALAVEIDGPTIRIVGSGLSDSAVSRVGQDLRYFRTPIPSATARVPPRTAFVATINAVINRGWSLSFQTPRKGELSITVDTKETPQLRPTTPVARDESPVSITPEAPVGDDRLIADIQSLHERRFEFPPFDPDLLVRARATGRIDVLATTLLVGSGACYLFGDPKGAETLLDELWELIERDPSLRDNTWPGPEILANRDALVAEAKGDLRRKWRDLAWSVQLSDQAGLSSQFLYTDIFELAKTEIDRGDLTAAWQLATMCDQVGTSLHGRSLELSIRTEVLSTEGQLEKAEAVSLERLALLRGSSAVLREDALADHAYILALLGRFEEAHDTIEELAKCSTLDVDNFHALQAKIHCLEGNLTDAEIACKQVRQSVVPGYGAPAVSMVVPVEAELHLRAGELTKSRAVLDSFAIEQHGLADYQPRLNVERRLAIAEGDDERLYDIVKRQLAFDIGKPRFEVVDEPYFANLTPALEAIAARDRAQFIEERSSVGAIVAHDLRNALSAATLVYEAASERQSDHDLARAERALEPIEALAQQLEDVALTGGSLDATEVEVFDLIGVIREVMASTKAIYERSGGRMTLTTNVPGEVLVRSRSSFLEVVLRHLINNAAKHGRPSGLIEIGVHYEQGKRQPHDAGSVTITVDDDGPGLPAELRDRFHSPTITIGSEDRGLGLGIVRRYAAALGLTIDAVVSPMGGARFTFDMHVDQAPVIVNEAASTASYA